MSTTPTPASAKKMSQTHVGLVWRKSCSASAKETDEPRLSRHTNPDFHGIQTSTFMPYGPILLGMGVVFNMRKLLCGVVFEINSYNLLNFVREKVNGQKNNRMQGLGVSRGLLQERPLQFQHGLFRVKSWQPMSNSWSTSSQPDFVRALVGEKQHEITSARFCTQSCSKVGQLLANSPSHGKLQGSSLQ